MPKLFANLEDYPYRPGDIFLGKNGMDGAQSAPVGVPTDRHALTIGGARSGKGACLLIPNARRWPFNMLVIDPKGENVAATWEHREALGQPVYALDPFNTADIPPRLRASFNPLDGIDPAGFASREDVEVIADGLVRRHDPRYTEWDDGARDILAGIIAYVIGTAPPAHCNLSAVRAVLLQEKEALYADAQRMLDCTACGGLAKAAAITIMTALTSEKGMEKDFLAGARRHSKWIDSPAMQPVLSRSTFSLSDLKNGRASVYLVLPPHYIETHAAFLRLFVRCGMNAMAAGGAGKGSRCLFLLDEFFSLGRIDEIAKAAGLMPGYGLHLWPFLQDLGQLQELYGERGANTFFANADAHIFLGNSDSHTLEYISHRIGMWSEEHRRQFLEESHAGVKDMPDQKKYFLDSSYNSAKENFFLKYRVTDEIYARFAGTPRLTPQQTAKLVGKSADAPVATAIICFARGADVLAVEPAPYFAEARENVPQQPETAATAAAPRWPGVEFSSSQETIERGARARRGLLPCSLIVAASSAVAGIAGYYAYTAASIWWALLAVPPAGVAAIYGYAAYLLFQRIAAAGDEIRKARI